MTSRLLDTIRLHIVHPLNRGNHINTIGRFVSWQIASRLVSGYFVVPLIDSVELFARRGLSGSTATVYLGLYDFEGMGFLLHALRPGQLFVDGGANIGCYTLLAAAACGAHVVAIEPVPATYAELQRNVHLNNCDALVEALPIGLAADDGMLAFTTNRDDTNHVLGEDEQAPSVRVRVETLDRVLRGRCPAVLKLDLEGYEGAVLRGSVNTLRCPELMAIIVETRGLGARYGNNDTELDRTISAQGFAKYQYDPLTRHLCPESRAERLFGNTLYVRDVDRLAGLIREAPYRTVRGVTL